ncbi:MAG: DUF5028 domain-containing protein [Clostridiales bacterium]|nr:DUF5028 domain-containing protein [Clostridiales bacterium]
MMKTKIKSKTVVILVLVFAVIAVWLVRFIYLNVNSEHTVIEIYNQGEFVEYGDNFFYRSREQRNGYSIKVVSAKLMTIEDFLPTIGMTYDEYVTMSEEQSTYIVSYVLDVDIILKNTDSTEGNFDRLDTRVNALNFSFQSDDLLFDYMYPDLGGSFSFKVRENTEHEMHIPYVLIESDEQCFDMDSLMKKDLYLNITQYPVKKMIRLNLE